MPFTERCSKKTDLVRIDDLQLSRIFDCRFSVLLLLMPVNQSSWEAQQIREDVGYPTTLINNAGFGTAKDMLEETDEEIDRTFHVNNPARVWIVREFFPYIIQQHHGHIVTVVSMASFMTIASNVSYSCTKAAALSFHEGLTQERSRLTHHRVSWSFKRSFRNRHVPLYVAKD